MQLRITKDTSYGPGCAWLEISAAVPADVAFRLACSNSLKPNLGPHGWQSAPYEFRPRNVVHTSTGTRMLVGPEIVDRMQEDMQVKLEIPATGYVAQAIWPDIPVSAVRHQAGLDAPSGPHALPPLPSEIQTRIGESPVQEPRPPESDEEEAKSDNSARPLRRRTGETIWRHVHYPMTRTSALMLASFAFLLFAVIGYTYVDSRRSLADYSGTTSSAEISEVMRLLSDRTPQVERLFTLGASLHRSIGASRDLGLQAIQRAAEYDHAPSIVWLGQISDPNRTEWKGAVREPNAAEAVVAYARAGRLGNAQARELVGVVCGELRRRAVSAAEVQARDSFC
jgi:hypothetical protein